jgi:translation elongation factor EF-1beta
MERFLPSLKIHPCDADADTSAVEREIDELVNALYGLSMEEIKLVEGAAK